MLSTRRKPQLPRKNLLLSSVLFDAKKLNFYRKVIGEILPSITLSKPDRYIVIGLECILIGLCIWDCTEAAIDLKFVGVINFESYFMAALCLAIGLLQTGVVGNKLSNWREYFLESRFSSVYTKEVTRGDYS